MKKTILSLIMQFAVLTNFSQTPDSIAIVQLRQTVGNLQKELKNQKNDFSKKLSAANESIENLQSQIDSQKQTIDVFADSLVIKITENAQNANEQIAGVSANVSKKTLFGIIGGMILLLLSVALFVWLYRKQKTSRADIIGKLEKQKTTIEEQLVKEFAKQAEIMQSLVETLHATSLPTTATTEPDHSLALKLADEIILMERNISLMDDNTKGLKQLNRSIGKLKDNLAANGYEIPELLGKPYNEGLKVIVINSNYNEKLQSEEKVISKIVKPQVNYNDKMIQAAQIELNVG
jgi:molybdopterin converting factor small subunit